MPGTHPSLAKHLTRRGSARQKIPPMHTHDPHLARLYVHDAWPGGDIRSKASGRHETAQETPHLVVFYGRFDVLIVKQEAKVKVRDGVVRVGLHSLGVVVPASIRASY